MRNKKTINAIANVQVAIIEYFFNLVCFSHKVTKLCLDVIDETNAEKKNKEKKRERENESKNIINLSCILEFFLAK